MTEAPMKGLDQSPKRIARRAEAARLLKAKDDLGVGKLPQESKDKVFEELKSRANEAGEKAEQLQNADPYITLSQIIEETAVDKDLPVHEKTNVSGINHALSMSRENVAKHLAERRRAAKLDPDAKTSIDANDDIFRFNNYVLIDRDDGGLRLSDIAKEVLYKKLGVIEPDGNLDDLRNFPPVENVSSAMNTLTAFQYTESDGLDYVYKQLPDVPGVWFKANFSRKNPQYSSDYWQAGLFITTDAMNRVQPQPAGK